MILAVAVVIAIGVALGRGGRLKGLAQVPLQWGWLACIVLLVQIAAVRAPKGDGSSVWSTCTTIAMMSSYLLLLLFTWKNRSLPGIAWIGIGIFLNALVMALNGGWMPISPETASQLGWADIAQTAPPGTHLERTKDILLPRSATRLWWLSDWLLIPPPLPFATAFSPGDVCIAIGAWLLIQRGMLGELRGGKLCYTSKNSTA